MQDLMTNHIIQNYNSVTTRMQKAMAMAHRAPDSVMLVAIAKYFTASNVATLIAGGHKIFGENRVDEAAAKYSELCEQHSDLSLHMVGTLQSNKAMAAVKLFDVIHSLDRPRLAHAIADAAARCAKLPRLFVQVNLGDETQKSGIGVNMLDDFLRDCEKIYELPIAGLMCIPPRHHPPAPYFAYLGKLAAAHGLTELSMGMSGDFEQAIMLGTTHIRVGTALFGARGA